MELRRLVRAQLQLLAELGAPYEESAATRPLPTIAVPSDIYALLAPEMQSLEQEQLRVLLLDTRHQVRDVVTLYQGTVNETPARPAELFRDAVRANAPVIALAHNHPSGHPEPSAPDAYLTQEAAKAAELLGITLLDHVVIGHGRFVSLKERGVL